MGFFEVRKAEFYDDRGEFLNTKWFSKHKPTFKFQEKTFINDTKNPSFKLAKGLLYNTKFYHYNINNPKPLVLNHKVEAGEITSEQLNIIIETDVLKKLNSVNSGFLANLDFKTIAIIAVVCIAGYYIFKNGGIFK